jgi:hypothetical protein
MDKLYKPIFLAQLKSRMAEQRPDFAPYRVPKLNPLRKWFTSSSLYRKVLQSGKCLWIDWSPSDGVERAFFVLLGWSRSPEELPYFSGPKDIHYYSLAGPGPGFETASVNIQMLEGCNAIADFRIPTPWDQVLALGPVPTEAELKASMAKAFAEYQAVTPGEREAAVLVAMNEAMAVLRMVLPDATRKLEELESE